jgi:hypothetical protein
MGSHVVAVYEGQWFIAELCKDQKGVPSSYTRLSYMVIKGVNRFAWGPPDLHLTLNDDILLSDVVPEPMSSRGHLGLNKKDLKLVMALMVVVYFLLLSNKNSTFLYFQFHIFFHFFFILTWIRNRPHIFRGTTSKKNMTQNTLPVYNVQFKNIYDRNFIRLPLFGLLGLLVVTLISKTYAL